MDRTAPAGSREGHDPPTGYLYGNGNAIFFDAEGEQLPEFQRHGLSGVHAFRERFPDATIYWATWDPPAATPVHENVFEHITHPPSETEVDR